MFGWTRETPCLFPQDLKLETGKRLEQTCPMSNVSYGQSPLEPGITPLLRTDTLKGRRVGLVSHLAAIDRQGTTTAQQLRSRSDLTLACLMGPEHGFYGNAAAGQPCRSQRHPEWNIPVHSLYGDTRKPRASWLRGLDVLLIDLQDLGYRPYTYVSTLRRVLEAAVENALPVIVADRPIPLPDTLDGPGLEPAFESFVSAIPAPMVYGMTPGETALWLQRYVIKDGDVQVARMRHYHRGWPPPPLGTMPYTRPSPSIVSPASALCFPATVCLEGLPHMDHGRNTAMPFEVVGAPWTRAEPLVEALREHALPGVTFLPHLYYPGGSQPTQRYSGIRLTVTHPPRFKPVLTSVTLLHTLSERFGHHRVWNPRFLRTDFLDRLYGTDQVRLALQDRMAPREIAARWRSEHRRFRQQRKACLLYGRNTA